MSRRFYLRPTLPPDETPPPRHAFPRWFVPALIAVGAGLGLVSYLLIRVPNPDRVSHVTDPLRLAPPSVRRPETPVANGASSDARRRSFEGLRIQVLNGCGVKGLARIITPGLRSFGFDVRETKNAANFDFKTSLIIDRTGNPGMARLVADSLHLDARNVSSEPVPDLVDIDLTLIVGADYRRLKLNLGTSTQE